MKLTPEEICKELCRDVGTCPAHPMSDCEAYIRANRVLNAQLSNLQKMKLGDLREEIARLPEFSEYNGWVESSYNHGHRFYYEVTKAKTELIHAIISLIAPILAAKLEAAEKAGMEKVVEWIEENGTSVTLTLSKDGKTYGYDLNGIPHKLIHGENWQAFLKKNGLEVKP